MLRQHPVSIHHPRRINGAFDGLDSPFPSAGGWSFLWTHYCERGVAAAGLGARRFPAILKRRIGRGRRETTGGLSALRTWHCSAGTDFHPCRGWEAVSWLPGMLAGIPIIELESNYKCSPAGVNPINRFGRRTEATGGLAVRAVPDIRAFAARAIQWLAATIRISSCRTKPCAVEERWSDLPRHLTASPISGFWIRHAGNLPDKYRLFKRYSCHCHSEVKRFVLARGTVIFWHEHDSHGSRR